MDQNAPSNAQRSVQVVSTLTERKMVMQQMLESVAASGSEPRIAA